MIAGGGAPEVEVAHTLAMRARELTGNIILHTTAANADTSIVLALSVAVAQFSHNLDGVEVVVLPRLKWPTHSPCVLVS
jgi:hypothetical protein